MRSAMKGNVKRSRKPIPNIQASPNHICFKNYEEAKVYRESIRIVHQDTKKFLISVDFDAPKEIKLSMADDFSKEYFENGDELTLEVEFCPTTNYSRESADRRYEISLNIINSNTKLLIPIIIQSPNPAINFPIEIQLPDTAINTPSYANIVVLNYSNQPYKFSIESKNEVKIIPDCKIIAIKPGDGSSFLIEFIPKMRNDFREKIYICFENEKRMAIVLRCKVNPVNIFLDKDYIEFSPTFIGMRDIKSIHIVNNSEDAALFEWKCFESQDTDKYNETSFKCLDIFPKSGELKPQTITQVDLIFKPEDKNNNNDDADDIQKEIFLMLGLRLSICQNYNPSINVRGEILGPTFQLYHKDYDINEIFVGETRNIELVLKNIGKINGKFIFHKIQSVNDGIIKISRKSEALKPGEIVKINLKFLARKIGKFIDQGIFKVKNGDIIKFTIQGLIKPLHINVDPRSLEFYASTICVPKLKFLKLINELPFDVDIAMEIQNNGVDDPLEFIEFYKRYSTSNNNSISKSSSFGSMSNDDNVTDESCLSLLTRTSIKSLMESHDNMKQLRDIRIPNEIVEIFNKLNEHLEHKEIMNDIVNMLFDNKLCGEIEKARIIEIIIELLIENMNEFGTDFVRFDEKDWRFPDHPRQIECDRKLIKLSSNNTELLKVFVTPNSIGKFTRNLKLHIRKLNMSNCKFQVDETILNVPIVIDCRSADIKIHSQTNDICGYVESKISLNIQIENVSNFDGFFTLPKFIDSEMIVTCQQEKFHIDQNSMKIINLIIKPLVSGQIIKYINIIALGSNRRFPITIECKSLPPDIIIKPMKIFVNELEVLKKDDTRIFIENRSTTKARFFIKLEHDNQCFNINPRGGILSSKQCIMVMVEKIFCDPGDYSDILIVEIVNSRIIKIPIKCTVKKLPIIIEPSFSNLIDFGTLFTSRNAYFLDYKFTNAGKISYMIFIILKNWRNRNEISYKIEPNRFELTPNCSQVVKFSLNAVNALSIEDEFTIEGCSSHFPIRELIWESKLKANVIKPTINFSTNEVIFNCYYGQEDDIMESFKIINNSSLSVPVTIRVEGEFSLHTFNQTTNFSLNVKENREIFIKFNHNLLKTFNESRTIDGKIKVYSLGKLQGTLKLIAYLIYPEIELSTDNIKIIANIHPCTARFFIRNPNDKIAASFELKFRDNSTVTTPFREKRQENLLNIVDCLIKKKSNLTEKLYMDEIKSNDGSDSDYETEVNNDKFNMNDIQKCGNLLNFNNIEVSSKAIINYIDSVAATFDKALFEKNNEKHVDKILKFDDQDKSCLSISQTKGILKPKEKRLISIQFSGSKKAFHLSSIISCQVMGGCCYDIHINMTNCNPNVLITKTYFEITNSWHKISIDNLSISTINPIQNIIRIISSTYTNKPMELIEGYVKLMIKNREFILDDEENTENEVKFTLFTGCMPVFKAEFGIQINDKPPIPVSFYGKNQMPLVTLLETNRDSLYNMNKSFEYDCLRQIFNEFVDHTAVNEEVISFEEVVKAKAKFQQEQSNGKGRKKSLKKRKTETMVAASSKPKPELIDNLSMGNNSDMKPKEFELFFNSNGRAAWREKPTGMYMGKMLHILDDELEKNNFLALDYPNGYPQAMEIISYIAQYGFTKSLESDEIFRAYKRVYDRHVVEKFKHSKLCRGRSTCRDEICDSFVVVTLPLVLPEYTIDFGVLKIDEFYEKIITIYVHDGCTSVAIRSQVQIPYFCVEFLSTNCFETVNYGCEDCCTEKYVNRLERSIRSDHEVVNTLKRCHSFDFIEGKVHSREIKRTKEVIEEINRVYNEKMNTKGFKIKRDPFTMSQFVPKSQALYRNKDEPKFISLKISFEPKSVNYDDEMDFDEILYLDLHLGPKIPIHLAAKFIKTNSTIMDQ